jgi:murein tripeptide amidase MpaA
VYLQGAIHGNEPAADQGILALLGKMDANQTWTASLLEKLDILVLPRYNPDGVSYFQREFGSNIDPNREGTKLAKQQSRDIRSLVSSFDPHVVADMHEYGGSTVYGGIYR